MIQLLATNSALPSIAPGQWIGLYTNVRVMDANSSYYDTRFPFGYLRVHIGQ